MMPSLVFIREESTRPTAVAKKYETLICRTSYSADEEVWVLYKRRKEQESGAILLAHSYAFLFSFWNVFAWVVLPYGYII